MLWFDEKSISKLCMIRNRSFNVCLDYYLVCLGMWMLQFIFFLAYFWCQNSKIWDKNNFLLTSVYLQIELISFLMEVYFVKILWISWISDIFKKMSLTKFLIILGVCPSVVRELNKNNFSAQEHACPVSHYFQKILKKVFRIV